MNDVDSGLCRLAGQSGLTGPAGLSGLGGRTKVLIPPENEKGRLNPASLTFFAQSFFWKENLMAERAGLLRAIPIALGPSGADVRRPLLGVPLTPRSRTTRFPRVLTRLSAKTQEAAVFTAACVLAERAGFEPAVRL